MVIEYKRSLIDYLLNRRDFVSGSELSDMLGVSTKTVARLVKQINSQQDGCTIIESQRGRGYRLDYQNYFNQTDRGDERPNEASQFTSVERRDEVIKRLLMTSPQQYRIGELWGRFCISDSAVSSDLTALRRMLAKFHLTLERVGDYVWIEGSETDIRNAISDLLVTDDVAASGRFMQNDQRIQRRDAAFIQHEMSLVEDLMHSEIPYPYSINLFTHLYILIERYREVGALIDDGFRPQQSDESTRHLEIERVCEKVIDDLNLYLDAKLPESETYYLHQYLTSSRIDSDDLTPDEIPEKVRSVTQYLIDEVTRDPHYQDIDRLELFSALAKHMKPLLNRLENGIKVRNNLLEQIKLEYPSLFDVVRKAVTKLSEQFNLAPINDEETGFITVYFAQAVEMRRTPFNVLLVCTTGLGTAQLLRAKIQRRFSELNIVSTVALRDLNPELEAHPETDLVVSTVGVSDDLEVPTLIVSAMLTIEDQERLERKVEQIRKRKVS
jgi:activator of the mannose operon, transcriptional antiterminator